MKFNPFLTRKKSNPFVHNFFLNLDLMKLNVEEFEIKKEIMNRREMRKQILKKKIEKSAPEATISQELLAWDSEPQRVLSEEIAVQEG